MSSASSTDTFSILLLHRAQVAVFVRPFIPDPHSVLLKILDIGISGNEPQEFVYDGLEMQFFRSQHWKSFAQVKAHLMSEDTLCARTGAVGLHGSAGADTAQKFKVLFHDSAKFCQNYG